MKAYKFTDAGIQAMQRKGRWRIVPTVLILAGMLSYFQYKNPMPIAALAAAAVIIAISLTVGLRRGLANNLATFRSFRIILDQDGITRQQLRIPDITISRQEVTSMRQTDSGLLIRGKGGIILVPALLESYVIAWAFWPKE